MCGILKKKVVVYETVSICLFITVTACLVYVQCIVMYIAVLFVTFTGQSMVLIT